MVYTFAENFDDGVMLRIDGIMVLADLVWNAQTSGTISLAPGWHTFDMRLGQQTLGVGPSGGTGIDSTGLGVAYSNAASGGWQAITDSNGNFLDTGASVASFLSPSTTVSVANGAILDLSRSTQTVMGVSGTGIITNGHLTVTESISPAGSNVVGTLTVKGNLTVGLNAVHSWDYDASSADTVVVSGNLTLPANAVLNLNALAEHYRGQRIVLYSFGTYSGPMDLHGWTVSLGAAVKVDLVNKQIVLMAPGTLLMFN